MTKFNIVTRLLKPTTDPPVKRQILHLFICENMVYHTLTTRKSMIKVLCQQNLLSLVPRTSLEITNITIPTTLWKSMSSSYDHVNGEIYLTNNSAQNTDIPLTTCPPPPPTHPRNNSLLQLSTTYPNCRDGSRLVVHRSRSCRAMSNLGLITPHWNHIWIHMWNQNKPIHIAGKEIIHTKDCPTAWDK